MMAFIRRNDTLIISLDGVPYAVEDDSPLFEDIKQALNDEDEEEVERLLKFENRPQIINALLAKHDLEMVDEQVTYNQVKLPLNLQRYLLDMSDSLQVDGIVAFIKKTMNNPNDDVRNRIFDFINRNQMPIAADGSFIAYKVVTSNYRDKHTQTFNYSPGQFTQVSWSMVDTNNQQECSQGLHACSYKYIESFYNDGDRIISVAIDPRNVGAIPTGYHGSKLRCRAMRVIADITDKYLADGDTLASDRSRHTGWVHSNSM